MRYQDYVIKDGQLVGKFEEMYREVLDPWHQSDSTCTDDSRRLIALEWIKRFNDRSDGGVNVCEIGCGFGHMTARLTSLGIRALGTDVSSTAVSKARSLYPEAEFHVACFDDFALYVELEVDVFLLSEVSWYVLDKLVEFKDFLKDRACKTGKPVFLVHLLSVYAPGEQTYGNEYFTNEAEINEFFGFEIIESGTVTAGKSVNSIGTYLIAKI